MTGHGARLWLATAFLIVAHLAALGAELIAPYHYSAQFREFPFEPPAKVRFGDPEGSWSLRPWVGYREGAESAEPGSEETELAWAPVRFLVRGAPRQFGPLVFERRLFGVEEPARMFLLGTDESGRDVFSRLVFGARISLFAGILAGGISVLLGFVFGVAAGFYGGRLEEILMRTTELFLALPWLYLLFGVRALLPIELGPVRSFFVFVLIVGGIGWARPARLFRGVATALREQEFVLAARSLGATDLHLIRRHVLPHGAGVFWTQFALLAPKFVVAEVTLSFLGLGVAEPMPSWGNMLGNASSLQVLSSHLWMLTPAVALLIVVLCFEPLTDRLRASPADG